MNIIPAIDLLGGRCVRLTRGDYDRVARYPADPVQMAREFEAAGAGWIHLVDLDAAGSPGRSAEEGRSAEHNHNRRIIRDIARAVSCQVETGGGIRRLEDVEELVRAGAKRLVIGTALVREPEQVRRWCTLYPGVLWAGIDANRGMVKVAGWREAAELQDLRLAAGVAELGLAGVVYTSIGRDGTLEGPDLERTNRIAEASGLPVILSGGIGSMEDVRRVTDYRHPGIDGLIIGKAIYQGRVKLDQLFAAGG